MVSKIDHGIDDRGIFTALDRVVKVGLRVDRPACVPGRARRMLPDMLDMVEPLLLGCFKSRGRARNR